MIADVLGGGGTGRSKWIPVISASAPHKAFVVGKPPKLECVGKKVAKDVLQARAHDIHIAPQQHPLARLHFSDQRPG